MFEIGFGLVLTLLVQTISSRVVSLGTSIQNGSITDLFNNWAMAGWEMPPVM